jgi:hypothetical protein
MSMNFPRKWRNFSAACVMELAHLKYAGSALFLPVEDSPKIYLRTNI